MNISKFKAGDRVKIIGKSTGNYFQESIVAQRGFGEVKDPTYTTGFSNKVILVDGNYFLEQDLIKINNTTMRNAKYMVSWTEERDPQEFFESRKDAEKFIEDLIKRPNVKDIYLVELGAKYEVTIPTTYKLELVK